MNIAVIGAGVGGLTAAFDLIKAGHSVTIYERGERPGGLAGGFKESRWEWSLEKYYHHWFKTDKPILSLIDELGLAENVVFYKPKTVSYHDGHFYPLDSVTAVLKFPGFSFVDKMRFGIVTAYLKYISGWKHLEKYTAAAWIKKYYGRELYRVFFEPLLVGKFAEHYQDVTMAWFWARFKARSAKLGTYCGGFQQFLDDFTEILKSKGVNFRFNATISRISRAGSGLEISITDEKPVRYDRILFTASPNALLNISPTMPESFAEKVNALKGTGAIVVIFSLKHQLSREGYYWYNLPKSAGFPFLALVEHTNFVPSSGFNDEHIIYCGDYLDKSHPYFSMPAEDLAQLYLDTFARVNPSFDHEWVNQYWLYKTPYAQPVPGVDHSKKLLDIKTPIQGLYLATMSQIYPWDRGTNFAVAFAHTAVGEILSD